MASTLSQFIAPIPKRPVISVVIPAHNHEQWIARTIRSALKQSYPPFEVIVVDDDSNDETPEQVASIAARDSRVRYLRHAQRRGPQAACNTGLKNAQGDWLALLEVGDEWQPEKLNKQAALVESSPFLPGVIYSGYSLYSRDPSRPPQERCFQLRGHIYRDLLEAYGLGPASTLLVKKDLLEEAGGFDERFAGYNEWELCLRLAQRCLFDVVPEPLVDYNLYGEAAVHRSRLNTVPAYMAIVNRYRDEMISDCGPDVVQNHYEQARQRYLAYADHLIDRRKYRPAARALQLAAEVPPAQSRLHLRAIALRTLPWLYRWFYLRNRGQYTA